MLIILVSLCTIPSAQIGKSTDYLFTYLYIKKKNRNMEDLDYLCIRVEGFLYDNDKHKVEGQ